MSSEAASVQRVSATDAVHLIKVGYVCIDVRTEQEYEKGHPVGAWNVPFKHLARGGSFRPNEAFLQVMEALQPKDSKILVMGKIGKRSLEAAEVLLQAGYASVAEVRPGFLGIVGTDGRYLENGWRTLGLPEETVTEGCSYRELCEKAGVTHAA